VDSVPVREWQECLHKAEPLARAAGSRLAAGLDVPPARVPPERLAQGVFETVLAQHGRPLRLADHLARLARSVRELYGVGPTPDLLSRIEEVAATTTDVARTAVRVHVIPSDQGLQVGVGSRPLGPRLETCTLALATRSAASWRHKWVDRVELQAAEELTAPALPYFLDPSGGVAETSRGNLFVPGEDRLWRTPPAGEDLLPGATRRALLDQLADRGVSVEITAVTADEVATARAAVWTSSLSGAVAVSELDGRRLAEDGTAGAWTGWLGIG
jgi:para-aminobenzoate synthetase/4-amino-4-deoxychorismate lyase